MARAARYRRAHQGADRLLCSTHMTVRRELDGLEPLNDADGQLQ